MQLARAIAILCLSAMLLPACSTSKGYGSWVEETFPPDAPGATVILVREGKVVFLGAAGLANIELGVPMRPDHVLRIGSITKQFTAAAILLLQERNQLHVSDEITRYLPEFPTQGRRITIAHLLAHTAGIYSYTDMPGYWRGDLIRTDVTVEDIIGWFVNQPLQFSPGSEFNYSNSGYALLGAIIERVSGSSYKDFLRQELFEPLGLINTQYGGRHVVPRRAPGYEIGPDGEYRNALPISMTHAFAAGGLLSTVEDLARWSAALFEGRLLTEESVRAMTTAGALESGGTTEYGYGLYIRERDGLRVIGHSGGIHGYSTSALWLPEKQVYAAVMTNLENSSKANELVWKLVKDVSK